ncbi:MAG: TolC family protein [Sphingopyxis sp.]|nr:TolC family protein [Sphingopyxis sp.]
MTRHVFLTLATGLLLLTVEQGEAAAQQAVSGPIAANDLAVSPDAPCLDFRDALTLGARLAPGVQVAQARLSESQADLTEARSLYRPQVSTFLRTGLGSSDLSDNRIQNQAGVRGSQRLFDFGDSHFARAAARAAIAAREKEIEGAQTAAALGAGGDYLGWLELGERLEATREREAYFARQLLSTTDLIDTGGATIADRADIEAQLLEAQSSRIELEFTRARFAKRLAINIRSSAAPCAVGGVSATLSETVSPILAPDFNLDAAIDANPEILALRRTADGMDAQASREARSRYPILSLSGVASYADGNVSGDGGLISRMGIDLTMPLYTGSAQAARVAAARARTDQSLARVAERRRELEEIAAVGILRVNALRAQVERREKARQARADQFAAAERQFGVGLRTLPELIQIRLQFEASELERIDSRYTLLNEELSLSSVVGQLRSLADSR